MLTVNKGLLLQVFIFIFADDGMWIEDENVKEKAKIIKKRKM